MLTLRAGATALALVIATSFAVAQTTPAHKPAGTATTETTKSGPAKSTASEKTATESATDSVKKGAEEVKDWTEKKWNSMKVEWGKNKAQWNSCNGKAKAKGLTGKESWSFFYDCMKA